MVRGILGFRLACHDGVCNALHFLRECVGLDRPCVFVERGSFLALGASAREEPACLEFALPPGKGVGGVDVRDENLLVCPNGFQRPNTDLGPVHHNIRVGVARVVDVAYCRLKHDSQWIQRRRDERECVGEYLVLNQPMRARIPPTP